MAVLPFNEVLQSLCGGCYGVYFLLSGGKGISLLQSPFKLFTLFVGSFDSMQGGAVNPHVPHESFRVHVQGPGRLLSPLHERVVHIVHEQAGRTGDAVRQVLERLQERRLIGIGVRIGQILQAVSPEIGSAVHEVFTYLRGHGSPSTGHPLRCIHSIGEAAALVGYVVGSLFEGVFVVLRLSVKSDTYL